MNIRKANLHDIDRIAEIYEEIHTKEEAGRASIGWIRGVYPTRQTAEAAVARDDMFVMEINDRIVAAARINREQVTEYADAPWSVNAPADQVMVLHTLVVSPSESGKGYATEFVRFYENFALEHDCPYLRMDTNAKNAAARRLYRKLGYAEAGIVISQFNGIPDVPLVCLEKIVKREKA